MSFRCDHCGALVHARCIWGEFYIPEGNDWRTAKQRRWICGTCLVNTNVQYFDCDLRRWIDVFVVAFNHLSNIHVIKYQQDLRSVRLKHLRVREVPEMDDMEAHVENTPINNSIIELRDGVRCYKGSRAISDIANWNYHSLPQVVGLERWDQQQLSFRTNSNPKDNLINVVVYRR